MAWHYPLALALMLVAGCYSSHLRRDPGDAGRDSTVAPDTAAADSGPPAASCDLRTVECTALPNCHGDSPPETLYCDDLRICLASDPGDVMATAIAEVADRIQCHRADSCDFLCAVADGTFDDEVRAELCEIIRVAPTAQSECAIYGP